MKILHYIASIDRDSGGVTAYLKELASNLGQQLTLKIVTHPTANPVTFTNATVKFIPYSPFPKPAIKRQFNAILNEFKPDAVHINGIWLPMCYYVQKWACDKNITTIISPHGMLEPWILNQHKLKKQVALGLFQRRAFKLAKAFHATAESEKENLIKFGIKKPIVVVPNSIETKGIEPRTSWEKTNTLLFLSRIHPKKGIELLLKALAQLKNEQIHFTLLIAGEGDAEYIESLKQLTQKLGLINNVQILGGIYGTAKWDLFKSVDAFVLPSYSENFGIVVGEALVCQTVAITTKNTPWSELETHQCGWWIDLSVENLIIALRELYTKSFVEMENMGKNGRKLILAHYTSDRISEKMLDLYSNLISTPNG